MSESAANGTPPPTPPTAAPASGPPSAAAKPAGGRIRILVAEDEENLAQILCAFLRGRGHYVVCVGDGKAAVQALRDESFDVALLHILMPDKDGLETVKHSRT